MWKAAGISYPKYAEACAQAVRNVMKEDLRADAAKRSAINVRFAKWENGKSGPSQAIQKQ